MISCRACPLRRFEIFAPFSDDDEAQIQKFKVGEMIVEAGTTILMEGASSAQLYTALQGLAVRYKTLADGQRQVINFVFPGDFIGLQAGVMNEMQHSVESTTDMRLCVFDRKSLWQFIKSCPPRAFDLAWLSAVEEHLVAEALTSVGQRDAISRIAWALLRLYQRGDAVGLVKPRGIFLPFRQQDLADAMGLSLVHTNKTLARLRERGLAEWRDGWLKIVDIKGMQRLSGQDPDNSVSVQRPLM